MTAEEREMMERLLGEHTTDPLEKEIARLFMEFAIEAVEKERERCAKLVETDPNECATCNYTGNSPDFRARLIAERIRAGEVPK